MNKTLKAFRLSPDLDRQLTETAKTEGKSKTALVEEALRDYLTDRRLEYERIADLFLQKYDAAYKNDRTRLRLATREADLGIQKLMEIQNSILWHLEIPDDAFMGIDLMPHQIYKESNQTVKTRLEKYKQKSDDKKVK